MNRVLITGGAGFIGGWLARAIADEVGELVLVDNFSRGARDAFVDALGKREGVRLLDADLREPASLASLGEDFTHVFHFAAILGVQNVRDRPYDTLVENVRLLESALAFARRQSALERFVFASTSEVYAGTLLQGGLAFPTPETSALALSPIGEPRTSYMLSKLYGEAMVRHAGVPFTTVRPHNVYGPRMGMDHVIPQLLQKAHRAAADSSVEVFSVSHRRTFCYVDDAVRMLRAVAASPACEGETLNLGREQPEVSIGDLAGLVLDALGKSLAVAPAPETPGSPVRRCPDMSSMKRLAGVEAEIGLEEGIGRTYDWYRENVFDRGSGE